MIEVGKNFGQNDRYEILSILGEGGMGIVLKAYDTILKEYVAIKTLHTKIAQNESIKNRFLNEAKLCLALTHPNIIRVRDVAIYDDTYYMVLEYIQGVELKSIIKDLDIKDIKYIYNLIRPILQALDFAHNFTIHRDIKPANIMIKGTHPYLMDFGISKALEDSQLENHTIIGGMGTKKYISPEQAFNANDVDKRTDIYSMGVLLFELFTKQVPKNTAIQQPKNPSFYNTNISSVLDGIILKMLEPKPIMRQDSFSDIIVSLDNEILNTQTNVAIIEKSTDKIIKNLQNDTIFKENMVFIKGGNFLRGSGIESKIPTEKPRKSIYVDDFYINKYCVTNAQYDKFLQETSYKAPILFEQNLKNKPDHPVVNVTFNDAKEFCKFYDLCLPTEAQWEKTAKSIKNFIYPWGNEFDNSKANIGHIQQSTSSVYGYENGKSFDGIYNLSGNIWEWCEDNFIEDFYSTDEINNPIAKNDNELKVLRGGSFDFAKNSARTSFRFNAHYLTVRESIGFRVVKNMEKN
jgi:serine/threonine protein kinase